MVADALHELLLHGFHCTLAAGLANLSCSGEAIAIAED
jgi:hypothetical protein